MKATNKSLISIFRWADGIAKFAHDVGPHVGIGAATYYAFTAVCGSIPWLSLIVNLLQQVFDLRVDLPKFPDVLLYGYRHARNAAIDWLRSYIDLLSNWLPANVFDAIKLTFNFIVSGWSGDIVTTWILVMVAVYRGSAINRENDRLIYEKDPERFRQGLREAARLHKIDPDNLVRRVESGLGNDIRSRLAYKIRSLRSALFSHRVLWRNWRQLKLGVGNSHATVLIKVWSLSIFYAFLGVAIYLLFSGFSVHAGIAK